MVNYIFAFPGQGAQTPGMMQEICSKYPVGKEFLDKYSVASGIDILRLLWDSSAEELARSDNSQTAITAASLCAVEILKSLGVVPKAVAGFSLGEWGALCTAGVLSFEETVFAVKRRGEIMQSVCEEIATSSNGVAPGMAAVIGLSPELVTSTVANIADAYAVNLNSVKQTVIAGTASALDSAENALKQAGAKRVIRLKVAGPFHSPLMQKAAEQFTDVVNGLNFKAPKIAIFSNVTGAQITSAEQAKENAIKHIKSPVLWTKEESSIKEFCDKTDGAWHLLETGPGKVLTGLWRDAGYSEQINAETWEESSILHGAN